MQYIKSLDSLRAVAVFLVLLWHWLPRSLFLGFPTGLAGVSMFFVLSGFLITMILFNGRNEIKEGKSDRKTVLKSFYVRRTLRIFPIYYLVVVSAFLYAVYTGMETEKFYYFLTYTANFYYFNLQSFPDYFSHFWSLAVEEQFYLLWPWLMLFVKEKYLLLCISVFIAVGVGGQMILVNVPLAEVLTFTCFDSLGMGALLAWFATYKRAFLKQFSIVSGALALGAALSLINFWLFKNQGFLPFRFQVSLISLSAISYIVFQFYNGGQLPQPVKLILENPLMAYLGKMSYGMYLYHTFIAYFTDFSAELYNKLPVVIKENYVYSMFVFRLLLLIAICILSWHVIEKPILRLKQYFQYVNRNKKVILSESVVVQDRSIV